MVFRPAKRTRQPATALRPVVDPAGWYPEDLAANEDWIYTLSDVEIDEVRAAVSAIEDSGRDILEIARGDIEMPHFDRGLAMLYDELLEGRGFTLIRGLPVAEFTDAQAAAAFWCLGTRFGRALSQNSKGHMLGHVKDFGGDYADLNVRGYQTRAEMSFHSDQCDYVALLCMRPSKTGGASRITSSVTIYNEMLKAAPELAEALHGEFYMSRHGEVGPGEKAWYMLPIFSLQDGYLSARGAGAHAIKAQELPGVPRFTNTQAAAFSKFQELARQFRYDMDFRPGDIQLLHNHVTVHTRTAFEDWPEPERKRHLMRLWLTDPSGRPLVPGFRENLQGIEVAGMTRQVPVNAFEPA